MDFFRSMEVDPTCEFSSPQSLSEGTSCYVVSAYQRLHNQDPKRSSGALAVVKRISTRHHCPYTRPCDIFGCRPEKFLPKLRRAWVRAAIPMARARA
jgi:hypothetical protein